MNYCWGGEDTLAWVTPPPFLTTHKNINQIVFVFMELFYMPNTLTNIPTKSLFIS